MTPTCDWYVTPRSLGYYGRTGRCGRTAAFVWGDRYICANHAASWIREGKTMKRITTVNPYPGSWLWERTE